MLEFCPYLFFCNWYIVYLLFDLILSNLSELFPMLLDSPVLLS